MTYVSLSISDSMFSLDHHIFSRRKVSPGEFQRVLETAADLRSAVNPSHGNTVAAVRRKLGITLPVPERAEKIQLQPGDTLLVVTVHGLPRETREFSDEEIDRAEFSLALWTVAGEKFHVIRMPHDGVQRYFQLSADEVRQITADTVEVKGGGDLAELSAAINLCGGSNGKGGDTFFVVPNI